MSTDTDGVAVFPSRVLILGLGETGLASALWCLRQSAALHIVDTRDCPPGLATLQEQGQGEITQFLGAQAFTDAALEGVQQIVLSPGLAPSEPALAAFLEKSQQRQIPVIGEIELFALALGDLATTQGYKPKVLAITGTNGKTTVTSLTQAMLETAGKTPLQRAISALRR
jgi:UDP-N-acetylmuramoylalanine--D-glutamate ligase